MTRCFAPAFATFLAAGLAFAQPPAGDKGKAPDGAEVLIVAPVTGFSDRGKDLELRLQGPPGGDPLADAIYVELPRDKAPMKGGKPEFLGRKTVAVRGRLVPGKVAVAQGGAVGAKPITALTLRVVADRVEVVDDKNKGDFPEAGKAVVRGRLAKGAFAVREDENMPFAIESGHHPVVLVGKAAEQAKDLSGAVRATGRLRLVRPGGAVVLDVESIAADKAK